VISVKPNEPMIRPISICAILLVAICTNCSAQKLENRRSIIIENFDRDSVQKDALKTDLEEKDSKQILHNKTESSQLKSPDGTSNFVTDSLGKPLYLNDQIILSFHPSEVDTSVINDTERLFVKLSEIIDTQLLEEINNTLGVDMQDAVLKKMVPWLKSTHLYSTSRGGNQVRIPPYWCYFVLFIPAELDVFTVKTQLKSLQPGITDVSINVILTH
jgi:hypothetical protein